MGTDGSRNPHPPPAMFEEAVRSDRGSRAVVVYDGGCGLCRRLMQFARRRDARRRLEWLAAGSEAGQQVLAERGLLEASRRSLVLVESNGVLLRSAAVLRICWHLGWPWKLLCALVVIPRPWRDALYDWVARKRRSAAVPRCSR
jgi:predicted DCC family thiol-disulfide oxidoreductase YuxK